MALPIIAAGIAARVVAKKVATKAAKKVATNATKKTSTKVAKSAKATAQKSKTNQVAKNSVKVKPANKSEPSNATLNSSANSTSRIMKSGVNAKIRAKEVEAGNTFYRKVIANPDVIRVKSSSTKPYKVTGGAGSTARRAGEKATKRGN